MPNLYIIAGPNGAGKTTASLTVLPEVLDCREFVNADMIAASLSPFKPEAVAFEAGRLMLLRIKELLQHNQDFAFETTLATRSYASLITLAKKQGYTVTLLFFWLRSPLLARERVAERVQKGGHNIPSDIIDRRYNRGLENFFKIYKDKTDRWLFYDNSEHYELLAEKNSVGEDVKNYDIWYKISGNERKV